MDISNHLREKAYIRALDLFESAYKNNDYDNVSIKKSVQDKILDYQSLHLFNMISALKNNPVVIDGSQTGTGKTYTTSALCAQLNLSAFVICPKNIISSWRKVLDYFNVNIISVTNYETICKGKYYMKGKKELCPFIKLSDNDYEWNLPSNVVLIFDEAHRCKSPKTNNGKILMALKKCRKNKPKIILLSATLCDKLSDFGVFGMMLDLYKTYKHGKSWMDSVMREDKNQYGKKKVNTLNKILFPSKGSKMSLDDLGESFPMNQISIDTYNLSKESKIMINKYYDSMKNLDNKLTQLINIRQKIENIKMEIFNELIHDYYYNHNNKSIVVFVNFVSSYDIIINNLKKNKIEYAEINGKQDTQEREDNIKMFQDGNVRIIVCMIQAGGESISLHDTTGTRPRISLISPSYSRIQLLQTLGRIYRTGTLSPCLQKIIFCADTYEDEMAKILNSKKDILDKLTDDTIL